MLNSLSQSVLVNATRQEDALTANLALTHSTSLSNCVDLFFLAGACRTISEDQILPKLEKALAEDPLTTMKIIFWAGDIRGGAGERRFFRIALKWLDDKHPDPLQNNIVRGNVEFYNRWDSLFHLRPSSVLPHVAKGLESGDGLLAKWLPRRNQYNGFANKLMRHLGIGWKEYRRKIVDLSNTVEQQMAAKEWSDINYQHVPSVAMNKYRKAFSRNDATRFVEYLQSVKKGEAKINASAIFPYDIYRALKRGDDSEQCEIQWQSLPNYMENNPHRILPMCDVSGSMAGLPIEISVSLGIYISERNTGLFQDAFITFSANPTMQYLKGSFSQRVRQLEASEWGMNTNLQAAFDLILQSALRNNLKPEELPSIILILSDMGFDIACGRNDKTNFKVIEDKYQQAGYERPNIVFWNLNKLSTNDVPVRFDQNGTALISGASPSIIKSLLSGSVFTPVNIMKNTIDDKRYDRVVI